MSNIGVLNFTSMRGDLQGPRPNVSIFTRPGVAGHGLVVSAPHGIEQELETDYVGPLSTAMAQFDAAEALIGTVVSITDAAGTTMANCTILDVAGRSYAITGAGAGNDTLLRLRWRLIAEI